MLDLYDVKQHNRKSNVAYPDSLLSALTPLSHEVLCKDKDVYCIGVMDRPMDRYPG